MRKTDAFRRAAALMAALSITVSLAAPAFAGTYYIDYGDITIEKNADGTQTIKQNGAQVGKDAAGEETIITTKKNSDGTQAGKTENEAEGKEIITTDGADAATLESDLEGPAAEDSDFGPVVEDNYQQESADQPEDADQQKDADQPEGADQPESADQPKDADQQKDADQPEGADQPESADQQAQPQQAAPAAAAAPAASTPVHKKENGFWGNTITVINNFANTVLNLTLKDVKIDVSDTGSNIYPNFEDGKAALSVQGEGNVEIELDGDNVLKSGYDRAGLEKNTSTGTLTLKDDKEAGSGSLKAEGGDCGAGIGGGECYNGENITITGGTVTATGGDSGAGIGGGDGGAAENITITGGTVTAAGGYYGAGIGGGSGGWVSGNGGWVSGQNITITGGTVNADGGDCGAGIGGGKENSGSNVTVSGAAQVTATAGKSNGYYGAGATIGSGGNETGGQPVDGDEIRADIRAVTTGYIHHIIYDPALVSKDNPDGILKEWWEPERPQPKPESPQPNPEDPNAPAEESNEVDLGTPGLHVETLEGVLLPFDARQQGGTLRVTSNTLAARLHGTRQALEALREQGVEQIQFVTTLKTTTLSVEDLLAEGGSWFALEHDGLVSRRLSAAQAESLKCRMR